MSDQQKEPNDMFYISGQNTLGKSVNIQSPTAHLGMSSNREMKFSSLQELGEFMQKGFDKKRGKS